MYPAEKGRDDNSEKWTQTASQKYVLTELELSK